MTSVCDLELVPNIFDNLKDDLEGNHNKFFFTDNTSCLEKKILTCATFNCCGFSFGIGNILDMCDIGW